LNDSKTDYLKVHHFMLLNDNQIKFCISKDLITNYKADETKN